MTKPNPDPNASQTAVETDKEMQKELIDEGQLGNLITAEVAVATTPEELKETTKRLRDYGISIVVFFIYVIVLGLIYFNGGFSDFTNFTVQKCIFSLGALLALVTGLNFGYMNPKEKRFWAMTDMLWISMAVVSLSGFLNPVENVVLKGEVRTAAYMSEVTRGLIENDIFLAVKSMCANQSTSQQCKD